MDLSVVIINFNTKELTAQTVRSILQTVKEISFEIIVVDNSTNPDESYHSTDERITVLEKVENHGFGHACNFGASHAKGDYLLFLNSDTIVGEGALDRTVEYIRKHRDVGALGIRTHLADGSFDAGCKRGFPTPSASLYYFMGLDKRHPQSRKYGAYHQTFLPIDQTAETDCVSGAFLMMPRLFFNELGGFDEMFFMYGEDVDLCYRVKEQGKKVVYFAGAQIIHLKGESGLKEKSPQIIYHFHHAMKLFYKKHYEKKYIFLVNWLVYLGIFLKYRLTLLQSRRSH